MVSKRGTAFSFLDNGSTIQIQLTLIGNSMNSWVTRTLNIDLKSVKLSERFSEAKYFCHWNTFGIRKSLEDWRKSWYSLLQF